MKYKQVDGVDENGNPTKFNVEIPTSKGLEAWERIKNGIDTNIWECGYWNDIELIEKEIKTLDIIKNKVIPYIDTLEPFTKMTQEEYNLLKEVLL